MKSTDGKELQRYGYYYTRAGQCVTLHDWAEGQSDFIFLVSRFYEGETMEARLYPSGHTEITSTYEHEGEVEPVSELFKDVPIFAVEEEYKKKAEEVLALCQSIGKLEVEIKNSEKRSRELNNIDKSLTAQVNNKESALSTLGSQIEAANETLNDKTAQISSAEDRLGDLTQSGDAATVSKDELGELRKDQCKLRCLEAGGVDNWEWFDESLKDFRERYP